MNAGWWPQQADAKGEQTPVSPAPVVRQVILQQFGPVLEGASLDEYNEAWIASSGNSSVSHRMASAVTLRLLRPGEPQRAVDVLMGAADADSGEAGWCLFLPCYVALS